MSRKTTYRFFVMHRLPQIQILDEQLITEDERFRAEIYYAESAVSFFSSSLRTSRRNEINISDIPSEVESFVRSTSF